jgi:hypothetical protein
MYVSDQKFDENLPFKLLYLVNEITPAKSSIRNTNQTY